jgi:hypothetical protein
LLPPHLRYSDYDVRLARGSWSTMTPGLTA